MSLKGVVFNKRVVGASRLNTEDGTSGIIAIIPDAAKPKDVQLEKAYPCYNLKNFTDLGFEEGDDIKYGIRLFRHVSEFFRLAKENTKLYVFFVSNKTTSIANIFDKIAKKFIYQSDGDINLLMASTHGLSVIPTLTNELPKEVLSAIVKAQSFANWCLGEHKPLHVFIEGYGLGDNITQAQDLTQIASACYSVSVVVGQDLKAGKEQAISTLTDAVKKNFQKYADVGSYVGLLSQMQVNDNPGAVELFNIKDLSQKIWTEPGLSNGKAIKGIREDLEVLDTKGYVFGVSYPPYPGVYFNDGHVCASEGLDLEKNMNISSVMMSRTWNKAIRILWRALMPYIKKKFPIDAKTGKLPLSIVKDLEDYCMGHLQAMITSQELSSSEVKIDANSNLLMGDKILKIKEINLIPYGYTGVIKGSIGFKTQLT